MIERNNSDAMIPDPLTEGLQPETFDEHVVKMGGVNSFNIFGYWECFYFNNFVHIL